MKKETGVANGQVTIPPEKELTEYKAQVSGVKQMANVFNVTSQADMDAGAILLSKISSAEKTITGRKEEMTRPIMSGLASIRALFKPFETDLTEAKKEVKEKMLAYTLQEDAKAVAEEAKIADKVAKGTMKASTAVGKLEALSGKKVKANTRILRKLSITDESALPREFLVPNRELITKTLFEGFEVPGAILVEEKILVTK